MQLLEFLRLEPSLKAILGKIVYDWCLVIVTLQIVLISGQQASRSRKDSSLFGMAHNIIAKKKDSAPSAPISLP